MLECDSRDTLNKYIERAKELGARVVADNFKDPDLNSIVLADPYENKFEIGVVGHD